MFTKYMLPFCLLVIIVAITGCSGGEATEYVTCNMCEGSGKISGLGTTATCPACSGYGRIEEKVLEDSCSTKQTCGMCAGTGKCCICGGKGTEKCPGCSGGKDLCLTCWGTGRRASLGNISCSICNGSGYVVCVGCGGDGIVECDICEGSGICSICNGSKKCDAWVNEKVSRMFLEMPPPLGGPIDISSRSSVTLPTLPSPPQRYSIDSEPLPAFRTDAFENTLGKVGDELDDAAALSTCKACGGVGCSRCNNIGCK